MARTQLGEAGFAPDLEVELEDDAAVGEQLVASRDDLLLELEIGDAVDEQPADPVVAVVDGDRVALAAELLGGGKACRTGPDDADRLVALADAASAA